MMSVGSVAFLLSLLVNDEAIDPGLLLYHAFASKCQSNGMYSARALHETESLKDILVEIKNDDSCRGLSGIFSAIYPAEEQFSTIHLGLDNEEKNDLIDYERRLTISFQLEVDPATKSLLQQEIAQIRMKIQSGDFVQNQKQLERREESVVKLSQYLQIMSTKFPDYLQCFQKRPAMAVQLASQLLSISGGFFDPTMGLAISLAGRLIGTFFDFLSNYDINQKISDYRKTTLRAGLTCAMEALEQSICDIDDQQALVDNLLSYRSREDIPEAWYGYELFRKDYPILQKFMITAQTGPDPETQDQGQRQANYFTKEGNFRASERLILGILAEAERDLKLRANLPPAERQAIVNNMIDDLAGQILGNYADAYRAVIPSTPNPHTRLNLWLRLGIENIDFRPRTDGEPIKDYYELSSVLGTSSSPYDREDAVVLIDIDRVRHAYLEIQRRAQVNLEIERLQNVNTDQEAALSTWSRLTQVLPDAGVVMEKLVAYLKQLEITWPANPNWFSSPAALRDQLSTLKGTRERLERAYQVIMRDEGEAKDKLKELYFALELRDQDRFMTNRLREIVEQDLILRLRSGMLKNDQQILDILVRLSTETLIRSLSPADNPDTKMMKIKADLRGARETAIENLYNFYSHFGSQIGQMLDRMYMINNDVFALPPNDPAWEEYSKVCILALNNPLLYDPENPQTARQKNLSSSQRSANTEILKFCQNQSLQLYRDKAHFDPVVNPYNEAISVSFAEKLKEAPVKRFCSYRRYQNQTELYEVLRHRPSAFFENYPQSEKWFYDVKNNSWQRR